MLTLAALHLSCPRPRLVLDTYRQVRSLSFRKKKGLSVPKERGKSFGSGSLQNESNKCHICSKTVYTMEFVGAAGLAFHKQCFRCKVCNCALRADSYSTVNGQFYCNSHYQQKFMRKSNYDFDGKG